MYAEGLTLRLNYTICTIQRHRKCLKHQHRFHGTSWSQRITNKQLNKAYLASYGYKARIDKISGVACPSKMYP